MVPNHSDIPQKLYATGLYDLTTHDGQAAFTDAVVTTLHARDANWRHLKKSASQTHIHRHGEDSALYLLPDDKAQAVDFVGGAGGPNPKPGWIVDPEPIYKHSDAHDPDDHGIGESAAPVCPPLFGYPDEPTYWKRFQDRIKAAYKAVGRDFPDPNDADAFRRFSRCGFDCRTQDAQQMADKHIAELRRELGAPPE